MKKKIFWSIVILLVLIQFFRPSRNSGEVYGANDITKAANTPAEVKSILKKACNDCHSDHTDYPWYANLQPVGWWLANHVNDGKRHLNFSQFNTYKLSRKIHKLEETAELVKEGEMPMSSYTWIHSAAKLSEAEKEMLVKWALSAKAALDTVKAAAEPKK
jgi:hypothetical protein